MDWTAAYWKVMKYECGKCVKKCNEDKKIICVEMALIICEDLEISEALHDTDSQQ